MTEVNTKVVRDFLVGHYAAQFRALGLEPDAVPDSFDLMLGGVIDSMGVLEMVSALESRFGVQVDMEGLDPEQMTILGPLSKYIASALNPPGKN
jgi:acyl carrier protein